MVGSAADRALDRIGDDVDVINYTKTGEDEYGENYSEDASISTKARVVTDDPDILRDAIGSDADVEAAIFVKDSVTVKREGGGDGATRIDVDGDGEGEWVVVLKHDQGNGLFRLDCTRRFG